MKIAINLLQLSPGRTEGVVTYVRELVRLLPNYMEDNELYILQQPGLKFEGIDTSRVNIVRLERPLFIFRAIGRLLAMAGLKFPFSYKNRVQSIIDRNDIDIMHYPLSAIPPEDMELKVKVVLSIMDLQHEYYPELFSAIDLKSRRAIYERSAKRADHIISISGFTSKSIEEKFNITDDKITTVPLAGGLSASPYRVGGLPKDFMLLPAADWHHKNHIKLFDTFKLIKNQGFEGKLVLTGFRSSNATALHEHIKALGLGKDIIDLGPVSFDQLAYIFKQARMLIYPTLFEGFGIPALEAMSVGLPVACSNTTSLPEIVGNAAETFDPESTDEIAAAIMKVWSDEAYRAKLVERGYKQAAKFSWENTAKQTYQVYKDVYEQTK